MRITESRLRSIIRSVIVESQQGHLDANGNQIKVGDRVKVLDSLDFKGGGERRQEWIGLDGIVSDIYRDGTCSVADTMEFNDELPTLHGVRTSNLMKV